MNFFNRNNWRSDAEFLFPGSIQAAKYQRNTMIFIVLIVALVSFGLGACATSRKDAALKPRWTRSELVAWSHAMSSDTEENLCARFDECSRYNVSEAIPFAFLYARLDVESEGRTRWHVVAARRFLRAYSDEEIESRISQAMKDRPETAPVILRRTLEKIR